MKKLMMVLSITVMVFAVSAKTVSVTGTFEMTTDDNVADDVLELAAGSTLKLPSGAGACTLRPHVKLLGSATIDANGVSSLTMAGGLYAADAAYALTVVGLDEFLVGKDNQGGWPSDSGWARLDIATVNFPAGAVNPRVIVCNDVSAFLLPSCTVEIAPGARVLTMGANPPLARFVKDGILEIAGWTVLHGRTSGIAQKQNVRIGENGGYYQMPRQVDGDWKLKEFSIGSDAEKNWAEQIELVGPNAVFGIRTCVNDVQFAPKVTGEGIVVLGAAEESFANTCTFLGTLDFTGELKIIGSGTYAFSKALNISSFDVSSAVKVSLPSLTVGTLAAGSTFNFTTLASLTLTETGAGATVCVQGGETMYDFSAAASVPTVVGVDGTTIGLRTADAVTSPLTTAWLPAQTNWRAKVLCRFDASDESNLVYYPKYQGETVAFTNGFPLVSGLNDAQGGNFVLRNFRGLNKNNTVISTDEHREVVPYLVPNGLNGKSYLSFGAFQGTVSEKYKKAGGSASVLVTEARRLELFSSMDLRTTTSANAPFAILVFGSQHGGGQALLGSADGALTRGGHELGSPLLAASDIAARIDGESVDATDAGLLNGGWQIVSLDLGGKAAFSAIGWNASYSDAGGQNFAEIVIFETRPTDAERDACERELAAKWGLRSAYRGQLIPSVRLCGQSAVTISGEAEVGSGFSGSVAVPVGATLALASGGQLVPGESAVPAENLTGWYDPACPGAVYGLTARGRPANVRSLLPRDSNGPIDTADSIHFAGYWSDVKMDRSPWTNVTARGYGLPMPWMDFRNHYLTSDGGNALRSRKGKGSEDTGGSTDITKLPATRAVFMVVDSSRGGGNVLGEGTGLDWSSTPPGLRDGNGVVADKPIWKNATGAFADASARLDGKPIDATTQGYSGRPEVYSFVLAEGKSFQPSVLGYYNKPDGSGDSQGEIIGETIFYSQPLSEAARADVTAYLAYKWFGKVLDGYTAQPLMTVSGSGTVKAPMPCPLPDLTAFAGNLDLSGTVEFALASDGTVGGAISVPDATIRFLPGTVVRVTASEGTFPAGEFVLANGVACEGLENMTLEAVGTMPTPARAKLLVKDGKLVLSTMRGMMLIVQ